MVRKDLVVAVLAIFCLTATMFLIGPTGNAQGYHDYSEWNDVNSDGKINILDVAAVAGAFGTSGDATRNVNITNWPQSSQELRLVYNESKGISFNNGQFVYVAAVDVTGYKKIDLHAKVNFVSGDPSSMWINVYWNAFGIETLQCEFPFDLSSISYPNYHTLRAYTLDVRSPTIDLYISMDGSPAPINVTLLTIAAYLQN